MSGFTFTETSTNHSKLRQPRAVFSSVVYKEYKCEKGGLKLD